MATTNLFGDPIFKDGAFTANDPKVRAYALQKTMNAIDLGAELGASSTLHHLVGFERITLKPGESRPLKFTVTSEMMSFFDDDGRLTLEPGDFRLEVGGAPRPTWSGPGRSPMPVTAVFKVK